MNIKIEYTNAVTNLGHRPENLCDIIMIMRNPGLFFSISVKVWW